MSLSSPAARALPPYLWPDADLDGRFPGREHDGLFRTGELRESSASVRDDSRWPAFFPAPICVLSTGEPGAAALERVVGPMIVNRFPLVMAISLCREDLSSRHYARRATMQALERSGGAAVQFLAPGAPFSAVLDAIGAEPDAATTARLRRADVGARTAALTGTPLLEDAYLVYEGRLARPGTSLEGIPIYEQPWADVGSHRIYFLEVLAIHLRSSVARGEQQIEWQSLPTWTGAAAVPAPPYDPAALLARAYVKNYTPDYRFPAPGTVAFEPDEIAGDTSIRHLPPLAGDQVVVDNERARWPCFFPSSAGMITAWQDDGRPTAMPCGSTAVVSRLPMTFAACISNSAINERYAPRATLATIRARGRFGVGVPYKDPEVVRAITYLGNVSAAHDPDKVAHAGLTTLAGGPAPLIAQLPIHFDCRLTGEVALGTHVMVLGAVERIQVRRDVGPERPLGWQPWARLT